ncbi:hypothetical protein AMTR_s00005p00261190 [Amborella trichopoda]|uniref:Uncharacterized protein n=1 Tax=Amborella trichopoda TaxID=13333 RepID=W1PAJ9_AMBTC|nr:hypothetical protein AMTR_s00005p00261190 [Amborella trichopoda]
MYFVRRLIGAKRRCKLVSSLWFTQSGARKYLEKDEEHRSELNRKDQRSKKKSKEKREKDERDEENQSSIAYLKMNNTDLLCLLGPSSGGSAASSSVFLDPQVVAQQLNKP